MKLSGQYPVVCSQVCSEIMSIRYQLCLLRRARSRVLDRLRLLSLALVRSVSLDDKRKGKVRKKKKQGCRKLSEAVGCVRMRSVSLRRSKLLNLLLRITNYVLYWRGRKNEKQSVSPYFCEDVRTGFRISQQTRQESTVLRRFPETNVCSGMSPAESCASILSTHIMNDRFAM